MVDSSATPDPTTKQATDAATLEKARADARKARSDADASELNARLTRAKAVIGEASGSGYMGATTQGDGAAIAETNLLARDCLVGIVSALQAKIETIASGSHVYLTNVATMPATTLAATFDFQVTLFTLSLYDAIQLSESCLDEEADAAVAASGSFAGPVAVAGLVLNGAASILSFFKSDFTLGGRELKPGDRPLLVGLAAMLIEAGKTVRIDGFAPIISPEDDPTLVSAVNNLATRNADAKLRSAKHAAIIAQLTPKPVLPGATTIDPDPQGLRFLHTAAQTALDAAVAKTQSFLDALTIADDDGCALQRIASARALRSFLGTEGATVLVVQLDGAWASTIATKNLFSGLFSRGLPFRISALAGASWWSVDGKTQQLKASGTEIGRRKFAKLDSV